MPTRWIQVLWHDFKLSLSLVTIGEALACLLIATPSRAAELAVYLMEVPPLTSNEPGRRGVVGDATEEALRRAGYKFRWVTEPNNRAMLSVQRAADAIIIPLARLPDRETDYTWIAPVVHVQRAFYSLETQPANTFAEARDRYRTVAVARGSAGVSLLLSNGFAPDQIVQVTQGDVAAKMLIRRRVEAWFNPRVEANNILHAVEGSEGVRSGAPTGNTYNFIACSRQCDAKVVVRLRTAVDAMIKDGSMKTIKQRYKFEE